MFKRVQKLLPLTHDEVLVDSSETSSAFKTIPFSTEILYIKYKMTEQS
jgi:hypothetical protein